MGVLGLGHSPLQSLAALCYYACLTSASEMERACVLSKEGGDAVGTRKERVSVEERLGSSQAGQYLPTGLREVSSALTEPAWKVGPDSYDLSLKCI